MKNNMEKIINNYIKYLQEIKHLNPKTIKVYNFQILNMIGYCGYKNIVDLHNANIAQLNKWINSKNDKSNQYKNQCISSAKSFFGYLVAYRLIDFNPAKELKALRIESKGHAENTENIAKIRNYVKSEYNSKKSFNNLRNILLVEILFQNALRNFEIRSLNIDTINRNTGEYKIKQKGGTVKECVLSDKALDLYNKYLDERLKIDSKDDALFISSYKQRLSSKGLEKIINTICDKMGIEHKRVHQFRHDTCNILIESGVELEKVSKILGHSSPNITYKIYYSQSTDNKKKIVNENPIFK